MNENEPIVVIPSFEPEQSLLKLVDSIPRNKVVVVNDGSTKPDSVIVFNDLESRSNVVVLNHAVNMGKGAALKTAFNYLLLNHPSSSGCVTADCDGQHTYEAINALSKGLLTSRNSVVLGERSLKFSDTPFRSYFGNRVTSAIFWVITGLKIRDTQTGLRGLPISFLPKLLNLSSNRYEFETESLLLARENGYVFSSVPIETIYINDNASSHFNPLFDSAKIYFSLFRFTSSSLLSAVLDNLLFFVFFSSGFSILIATMISRVISAVGNFVLNRKYVFASDAKIWPSLLKYFILASTLMVLSAHLTEVVFENYVGNIVFAKLLVEFSLFFVSFSVQRIFVFGINND